MEDQLLDYFGAQYDPNVRIVTVKNFQFESLASLYAARLEQAGIDCFVSNANTITAFPIGTGGIGLHVKARDQEQALQLIAEMDANQVAPLEEDFREAGHEEIAYQKSLHRPDDRQPQWVWWALVAVIGLLILRAFYRSNYWVFNWDAF